MATKRKHRAKRRRVAAPHRRRRRMGAAPAYAGIGGRKRKRRKVGATHHRRRRIGAAGGGSMMRSLKDYAMMLVGGGVATIGTDMLIKHARDNDSLPDFLSDTVLSVGKLAVGGGIFHLAKNNPFFMGAGIGVGVSGIKDIARIAMPDMIGAPEKTLFVTLDRGLPSDTIDADYEVVNGPNDSPIIQGPNDSPIISGAAYAFSGPNDSPIISGNEEYEF